MAGMLGSGGSDGSVASKPSLKKKDNRRETVSPSAWKDLFAEGGDSPADGGISDGDGASAAPMPRRSPRLHNSAQSKTGSPAARRKADKSSRRQTCSPSGLLNLLELEAQHGQNGQDAGRQSIESAASTSETAESFTYSTTDALTDASVTSSGEKFSKKSTKKSAKKNKRRMTASPTDLNALMASLNDEDGAEPVDASPAESVGGRPTLSMAASIESSKSGATPLKSCLSSKKTKQGGTAKKAKTVVFGSPNAAEFNKTSPSNSMTPMSKRDARVCFPVDAMAFGTIAEDGSSDDEQTSTNTSILSEWEGDDDDGPKQTAQTLDFESGVGPNNDSEDSIHQQLQNMAPLPSPVQSRRRRRSSVGGLKKPIISIEVPTPPIAETAASSTSSCSLNSGSPNAVSPAVSPSAESPAIGEMSMEMEDVVHGVETIQPSTEKLVEHEEVEHEEEPQAQVHEAEEIETTDDGSNATQQLQRVGQLHNNPNDETLDLNTTASPELPEAASARDVSTPSDRTQELGGLMGLLDEDEAQQDTNDSLSSTPGGLPEGPGLKNAATPSATQQLGSLLGLVSEDEALETSPVLPESAAVQNSGSPSDRTQELGSLMGLIGEDEARNNTSTVSEWDRTPTIPEQNSRLSTGSDRTQELGGLLGLVSEDEARDDTNDSLSSTPGGLPEGPGPKNAATPSATLQLGSLSALVAEDEARKSLGSVGTPSDHTQELGGLMGLLDESGTGRTPSPGSEHNQSADILISSPELSGVEEDAMDVGTPRSSSKSTGNQSVHLNQSAFNDTDTSTSGLDCSLGGSESRKSMGSMGFSDTDQSRHDSTDQSTDHSIQKSMCQNLDNSAASVGSNLAVSTDSMSAEDSRLSAVDQGFEGDDEDEDGGDLDEDGGDLDEDGGELNDTGDIESEVALPEQAAAAAAAAAAAGTPSDRTQELGGLMGLLDEDEAQQEEEDEIKETDGTKAGEGDTAMADAPAAGELHDKEEDLDDTQPLDDSAATQPLDATQSLDDSSATQPLEDAEVTANAEALEALHTQAGVRLGCFSSFDKRQDLEAWRRQFAEGFGSMNARKQSKSMPSIDFGEFLRKMGISFDSPAASARASADGNANAGTDADGAEGAEPMDTGASAGSEVRSLALLEKDPGAFAFAIQPEVNLRKWAQGDLENKLASARSQLTPMEREVALRNPPLFRYFRTLDQENNAKLQELVRHFKDGHEAQVQNDFNQWSVKMELLLNNALMAAEKDMQGEYDKLQTSTKQQLDVEEKMTTAAETVGEQLRIAQELKVLHTAIEEQASVENSSTGELHELEKERTELRSKCANLQAVKVRVESKAKSKEELSRLIEVQCQKVSALEETHSVTLGLQLWKFTEMTGSTLACAITHPDR
jgi:hypothetical protein